MLLQVLLFWLRIVLGVIVAFVLIVFVWQIGGCCMDLFREQAAEVKARNEQREAQQIREQRESEWKARKDAENEKAKQQAALREEKLRSFTLKEAPVLWTTYQNLRAAVESQDKKIVSLRETLKRFNRDPDSDADFKRICSMRDEMIGSLRTMRTKIEDAYLASRKYEATPSRKDYAELRRKLLEDGIQEAESAAKKFTEMRSVK